MFVSLTLGGLIQGFALNDLNVNFMSSLSLVFPFRVMSAVGAVAVLVALPPSPSFSFAICLTPLLLLSPRAAFNYF